MSKNHHNQQCGFAEELVSFLYDEANSAEKIEFDAHLNNCSNCTEELEAFGFVRSSINVWRETEFFEIESPKISIPVFETQNFVETKFVSKTSRSWFDSLRDLFSLSPAWTSATAAIAVLAVISGLTYFLFNSSQNSEFVKSEQNNSIEIKEAKPENIQSDVNNSQTLENKILAKDQPEPQINDKPTPEKAAVSPKKENSAIRVSAKESKKIRKINKNLIPRKPGETYVAEKDKNNFENKTNSPRIRDIPKLTNFDDDDSDDSLRLADLFDEAGS